MMDYAALSSLGNRPELPRGTTAMLIDYGAQSPEEMQDMVKRLQPRLKKLDGMVDMEEFTHTVSEREKLWEVRNGIFPCVAGARIPGNAVVLEDVAAPVGKLADLVG